MGRDELGYRDKVALRWSGLEWVWSRMRWDRVGEMGRAE